MLSHARARLAALVDAQSPLGPLARARAICSLCADATEAAGVSLSVAGSRLPGVTSTVCATDALSVRLEELQLGLAEGPIADALESTLPVLAADLADVSHLRWLWFSPAAVEAGAAALFVLPLCSGETALGALSLYRTRSRDLTAEEFGDFREFADAATSILLEDHAGSRDDCDSWTVGKGTGFQPVIQQAVGVVMAQLDVDATYALARLRGHAFAEGRSISAVAHEVVDGRVRLEPDVGRSQA